MATLAFQRAIPGGQLGEGAAIAVAMIPFLLFATLFSYFALPGGNGSKEAAMTDRIKWLLQSPTNPTAWTI